MEGGGDDARRDCRGERKRAVPLAWRGFDDALQEQVANAARTGKRPPGPRAASTTSSRFTATAVALSQSAGRVPVSAIARREPAKLSAEAAAPGRPHRRAVRRLVTDACRPGKRSVKAQYLSPSAMWVARPRASSTGTAFPICRAMSSLVPHHWNSSRKPWSRAASWWVIARCCSGCR